MKIALVSDTHIHPWMEFSTPGKHGLSSRLYETVSVLRDVRKYCVRRRIKHVLHGGDLFHKRSVIGTPAWSLVCRELAAMKRAGIQVTMVDGNHDQANRKGTIHALQALHSAELAWIPRRGYGATLLRDGRDSCVVVAVSYCDDRAVFAERLDRANDEALKLGTAPVIGLMHHGFLGARVGSGLEYVVREQIDGKVLRGYGFQRCWSGHYHARQPIAGTENASYIGSPMQFVRGETDEPKGFLVYDVEKDRTTLVPLEQPRFVKLTQEQIDREDVEHLRGNYCDVLYGELPREWEQYRDWLLSDVGAAAVKPVPTRQGSTTAARAVVAVGMSDRRVLRRYIKYKKRSKERDELLRVGLDLLAQADQGDKR